MRTVHPSLLPKILSRHVLQAPRCSFWPYGLLNLILHVALFLPGHSWSTAVDEKMFHSVSLSTPSLGSDHIALPAINMFYCYFSF